MNKTVSIASALAAATCLVCAATVTFAASPTQTDFDACNRMAQSKVTSPSASPKTDTKSEEKASSTQAAPSQETASEARVANQAQENNSSASPRTDAKPEPNTPSAQQQAAPSQEPASEARVAVQADQLRGIADESKNDPAYQNAYRDCMKGRGF
jgi:hypothetical protein